MIQGETHGAVAQPHETGAFLDALDQLSIHDRHIVGRMVRRLAHLERAHGADLALAVAERLERIVRGRALARA